jgi:LuxR family maltose regulon positive regulatory protein
MNRAALLSEARRPILKNVERHDSVLTKLAIKLNGIVTQSNDVILLNPALKLFVRENALLEDPQSQIGNMIDLADRCSAFGSLSDAASLAAAAGRPDKVAQIAEQHGALLIWVLCGFSDLQSLVVNAGEEVISQSPVLRMMRCIVDLKIGQISRAETELQKLASDSTIAETMMTEVEIIRVTLLVYGCSLARQHDIELLADLLSKRSKEPAWQSFLATLSCILNSQRGRFETASTNLQEARLEAERAGSRYNIMFLFLHEAGIEIAQGALTKARASIGEARRMWREEFPSDIGVETLIAALSSKIEFETGRLTSARNALRKSANRLPDGEAWFDIYFAAYEPMARMLLCQHGLPKAIEFLESETVKLDARGLSRVGRLLQMLGCCLIGEARLRDDSVDDCAQHASLPVDGGLSWQERETYTLAIAYEQQASGHREEAIALLETACDAAESQSLVHSRLRFMLALFLFHHQNGRRDEAMEYLKQIVILASSTGMRQVAQDVLGSIVPQYQQPLIASAKLDEGQRKILKELARAQHNSRSANAKVSVREMDVIAALANGGSDKEIARELKISDHGVRYHLKNIFRKLGVHDRLAAVSSAKQKGWV